jgi:hypothetical protein
VLRLIRHAAFGWAVCASVMLVLERIAGTGVALVLHAILAPLIFILVARHYFAARGAREPLATAATFAAVVLVLDVALVAGALQRSLAMLESIGGTWLPLTLIFLATWATGALMSTLPGPKPADQRGR